MTKSYERVCGVCGAGFNSDAKAPVEGLTAMQKFVDHSSVHNWTPAQWTEAYNRIQAGKEREKKRTVEAK